jgi:membrane protease YdiL (CAAX protease family)
MSDEELPSDRNWIVFLAIGVEGGLIVLAWLLGWLLETSPLAQFAWTREGAVWGVLAAAPMLLGALSVFLWPVGPLRPIKEFSEKVLRPTLAPCSVLDLLGISVLAGLGEEMLFRGVLQASFAKHMNVWLAILLASVLFGVLHAVTRTYAVLATLSGIYLGWLWVYTGNLLAPVITHALYDFLVLLYLLRGPGSDELPEEEPEEEFEEPDEED